MTIIIGEVNLCTKILKTLKLKLTSKVYRYINTLFIFVLDANLRMNE